MHERPPEPQCDEDGAGECGVHRVTLVDLGGDGGEEDPGRDGRQQEAGVSAAVVDARGDAAEHYPGEEDGTQEQFPGDVVPTDAQGDRVGAVDAKAGGEESGERAGRAHDHRRSAASRRAGRR